MSSTTLRPFARSRVWAPTATEAAAFDRAAIERQGVPQAALMECAGGPLQKSSADSFRRERSSRSSVLETMVEMAS